MESEEGDKHSYKAFEYGYSDANDDFKPVFLWFYYVENAHILY